MTTFRPGEAAILNAIQNEIPLCERPFLEIGRGAGIPEAEVIETVRRLKKRGIIRNIAAIFNGESLGYQLSLVALSVSEAAVEAAAQVINSHPGVSHNYLREHHYNLWFTLALGPSLPFDRTVARIAEAARAVDHLVLRNEKLFKIGLRLPINDHHEGASDLEAAARSAKRAPAREFTDEEREAVLLLQTDLPIVELPFREILRSSRSAMTEQRLLGLAAALRDEKMIRRFAAVLRHMEAGFKHNAMTAWKPREGVAIEAQVQPFARSKSVTHLYLRTIYPGRWEHPLFAMVHARSREELGRVIKGLSDRTGMKDYLVLKSLREFKKERVIYFSPEFKAWRGMKDD